MEGALQSPTYNPTSNTNHGDKKTDTGGPQHIKTEDSNLADHDNGLNDTHRSDPLYSSINRRQIDISQQHDDYDQTQYNSNMTAMLRTFDHNKSKNLIGSSKMNLDRENARESLFLPEHQQASEQLSGYRNDQDLLSHNNIDPTQSLNDDDSSTHETMARSQGRPKGSKSKTSESKVIGTSRVQKPQSTAPTIRGGRKGAPQIRLFNTSNLFHHDIIAEAIANQDQQHQPTLQSTNKRKALDALFKSIPAEESDRFRGEKANFENASKCFYGHAAVRANQNGGWTVRGIKANLKHYQMLGVAWMRSREKEGKPFGGILGDDMGLGKTLSALANIANGREDPTLRKGRSYPTLIIVPPSLMNQWMGEIEKHMVDPGHAMVYRNKMKVIDPVKYLSQHDIIVTSYYDISQSIPKNNPPPQIVCPKAKLEWWEGEIEEKKGPLHRVNWHRVVLDEAQAIKNYLSKTSDAVCRLQTKYVWCLSGTPVQNGLEEFYPYFKFLKCEQTGSFELFKRNFAKRGNEQALQRLQAYLTKIMLRRTHLDKIFGKPILKLPPIKPLETIVVKFNAVERAIYRICKLRFIEKVNTMLQNYDPERVHYHIITLFLRLRQLVGHPLLIQKTLTDLLEAEDLEQLWSLTKTDEFEMIGDNSEENPDENAAFAQGLQCALQSIVAANSRRPSATSIASSTAVSQDNQLSADFRKYLELLKANGKWGEANRRALCAFCQNPPTDPYITSCHHLYCRSCLNDLKYSEHASMKSHATCFACGAIINKNDAFAQSHTQKDNSLSDGLSKLDNADEDIDWLEVTPMLRSAKVKGAVQKIREWFSQDPTNKIVVFTQFRGLMRVMERVCDEECGWGYATFHGTMSFDSRDRQIKTFSEDPACRILLIGLKCGGTGLNLTAGNRVIILDLWWNASVESQAFTRCFRIGQERDVEVVRFVVEDSIDIQIEALQERKKLEIGRVMDGSRSNMISKEDLRRLFSTECPTSSNSVNSISGSGASQGKRKVRRKGKGGPPGPTKKEPIVMDEPFIMPDEPIPDIQEDETPHDDYDSEDGVLAEYPDSGYVDAGDLPTS